MSDPERPSIHTPEHWQKANALNDQDLAPTANIDFAVMTHEQLAQSLRAAHFIIHRLSKTVEALALETAPKPKPKPKPKPARKPRATQAKPLQLTSRMVEIHDV
jgi:hypothetical protein